VNLDAAPSSGILGDGLAQGRNPGGRIVGRVAVLDGLDARLRDVVERGDVRLADLQVDDVAALRFQRLRARQHMISAFRLQIANTIGEFHGHLQNVG